MEMRVLLFAFTLSFAGENVKGFMRKDKMFNGISFRPYYGKTIHRRENHLNYEEKEETHCT